MYGERKFGGNVSFVNHYRISDSSELVKPSIKYNRINKTEIRVRQYPVIFSRLSS